MRKVFLDDLPTKEGIGALKGQKVIDWINSVGYKVKFVYDDIEGEIKIINYDNNTRKLNLLYLDNQVFSISSSHLRQCKLQELLGIKTVKYKFEVDDIIEGKFGCIKIVKQIRIKSNSQIKNNRTDKGYLYKCLKCDYVGEILETHLKEVKTCPFCSGRVTIKGKNDIATTHPYLVKYFVNLEDAYKYKVCSNAYINAKCDKCGNVKNINVPDLYRYNGISCPKCSDNISYPEKFMFNVLEQLNIKFEYQKSFIWSKRKKYDFYIPSLSSIIETHGLQHYRDCCFGGRTIIEEQENDNFKEKLAMENGIKHYIVIDCSKSELEFIKESILDNKQFNNIFNLTNIDWLKCHEYSCNSLVKKACDLWNSGIKSTIQIGKIMKLDFNTISKYLKSGNKLNWCEYKVGEDRKNELLAKICSLWNDGIKSTSEIATLLNISSSVVLKYLKNGYELEICDYTYEESMKNRNIKNTKSVICLETGMIFKSSKEVMEMSIEIFNEKFDKDSIRKVCNGKLKKYKGYTFKYLNEVNI